MKKYVLMGGPYDGVTIESESGDVQIDKITIQSSHVRIGDEDPLPKPGEDIVFTMRDTREDVYEDQGVSVLEGVTESFEEQLDRIGGWPLVHSTFPKNKGEQIIDDLFE